MSNKRIIILDPYNEPKKHERFSAISKDTKQLLLDAAKYLYPIIPKEKSDRKKLIILRTIFREVGLSTKHKYMAELGCYLFGISPEENKLATCVLIANYIMGWVKSPCDSIQKGIRNEIRAHKRLEQEKKRRLTEGFYQTWAWKSVRYQALKKYGAKCMLCGATPEDGARICVDHIKPRSKFPELQFDLNNLQILCDDCNKGKSNVDETDWR